MKRRVKRLQIAKQGKPFSPATTPNSLDVNYEITAANKDFISILFSFFEYTGGAHPNTITRSLNYDLNRNAPVNLANLFIPNSNYLRVISDYSIKELKKLETATFTDEGAAPKLENFHSWNITFAGLKITFDRYQVGAYAVGEHEVVVPYSALKAIINPDGDWRNLRSDFGFCHFYVSHLLSAIFLSAIFLSAIFLSAIFLSRHFSV